MRYSLAVLAFLSGALLSYPAAAQAPAASLTVKGDVAMPLSLSVTDLAQLPRDTVTVEEQDGEKTTYEGVRLQEVLKKAGVQFGRPMRGKALAGYVLAKAKDGYAVVFSFGELDPGLGNAHVIVADKRNGKPLFEYQGPLRLVAATDKAPARGVRLLEQIEVVRLIKE